MSAIEQREIWQRLLGLESHDVVKMWFEKIHARKLNARRTAEVNAAARQAHEYFRNANVSDYSVRPLLTFYGIACLGRSVLLMMKPKGGEEGLTAGHGLETVGWRNVMNGSIADDLKKLGELKMRRRSGLFSDFLAHVGNTTLIYHRSASVNGHWKYDEPNLDIEVSLGDLFSRTPDLWRDYTNVSEPKYANVSEVSYSEEKGFEVNIVGDRALVIARAYGELGYEVSRDGESHSITSDSSTSLKEPPMFVHAHAQKMLGVFPQMGLAVPFLGGARFSQLCITYIMSYALGMLARYFPTHWIAFINGGHGDLLWPTVNRAQQYVESIFPELVAEYLAYAIDNPQWVAKGCAKE